MDTPRRFNDCYYYYYSTCNKGEACPFRHEPASLKCEIICQDWLHGKCHNLKCTLRHMELRKDRSNIPCYWEDQPSGCTKPHCSFQHNLDRQRAEFMVRHLGLEQTVIPPSSTSIGPQHQQQTRPRPRKNFEYNKRNEPVTSTESPYQTDPSVPVSSDDQETYVSADCGEKRLVTTTIPDPVSNTMPYNSGMESIIVSIEEDSDNETPLSKPVPAKTETIHIKTLEEIRLERIQKESAAYYQYTESTEEETKLNTACQGKPIKRSVMDRLSTRYPSAITQEDFKGVKSREVKRKQFDTDARSEIINKRRKIFPLKSVIGNIKHPRRIVLAPDCDIPSRLQNILSPDPESEPEELNEIQNKIKINKKSVSNIKQRLNNGRIYINPNYKSINNCRRPDKIISPQLDFTIKTLQEIREDRNRKLLQTTDEDMQIFDCPMSNQTEHTNPTDNKNIHLTEFNLPADMGEIDEL